MKKLINSADFFMKFVRLGRQRKKVGEIYCLNKNNKTTTINIQQNYDEEEPPDVDARNSRASLSFLCLSLLSHRL